MNYMNEGFQAYNIRKSLARAGIDSDKFDIHAHMDRTLSFEENSRNIKRMVHGKSAPVKPKGATSKPGKAKYEFQQTGRSNEKKDKQRTAKAPGKRYVRNGNKRTVYYER